jgi:hypothetical protein
MIDNQHADYRLILEDIEFSGESWAIVSTTAAAAGRPD